MVGTYIIPVDMWRSMSEAPIGANGTSKSLSRAYKQVKIVKKRRRWVGGCIGI